ncbi:hypothetical protein WICPIJ_008034 [Wickerhamomyces pijperi]|uniref:Uncharacterized protein n=1 Tax=Wickerhamomyces pijperi TaxID=599730 RepID=A0A9P8Q1B3_WICPI|nr:hypothetical protein WICPIJ_008034 [Wickerhamomyces pijperi]
MFSNNNSSNGGEVKVEIGSGTSLPVASTGISSWNVLTINKSTLTVSLVTTWASVVVASVVTIGVATKVTTSWAVVV